MNNLTLGGSTGTRPEENARNPIESYRNTPSLTLLQAINKDADIEDIESCLEMIRDEIDYENTEGPDALRRAAGWGRHDIVSELLKKPLNMKNGDKESNTALHIAALKGHPKIITDLCQSNAKVGAKNRRGLTPLMIAALFGRLKAVRALLSCGAKKGQTAFRGHTAHDFAKNLHWTVELRQYYLPGYIETRSCVYQRRVIVDLLSPKDSDEKAETKESRLLTGGSTIFNMTSFGYKTVAILDRGSSYPYIVVQSGWSWTLHQYSENSEAINGQYWTNQVLKVASILQKLIPDEEILPGHDFDENYSGKGERKGRYYACHAEKMLMIYYLFTHHRISLTKSREDYVQYFKEEDWVNQKPKCVIRLSKEPCENCAAFRRQLRRFFGVHIKLIVIRKDIEVM